MPCASRMGAGPRRHRGATGKVLGVHDASLTVAEGEIVVLMGLSGSGKSTLLRAVSGLNKVVARRCPGADEDQMVSVPQADADPAQVAAEPCLDGISAIRAAAMAASVAF